MRVDLLPEQGYQDDPFTKEVKIRLRSSRNSFIAAIGAGRTGKSWLLLSLGEGCDVNGRVKDLQNGEHFGEKSPDVSPAFMRPQPDGGMKRYVPCFDHEHVSFLPQDFTKRMQHSPKGCFQQFDETASEFNNRRFGSWMNILISSIITTMNSRLVNVGLSATMLPQADINLSRALNYLFEMSNQARGVAKLMEHWSNPRTGKFGDTNIAYVYVAPPFQDRPEELKEYSELKKQYQSSKYDSYFKDFESLYKEESTRDFVNKYLPQIMKKKEIYLTPSGKIDRELVAYDFGLRQKDASILKKLVEREMSKDKEEKDEKDEPEEKAPE